MKRTLPWLVCLVSALGCDDGGATSTTQGGQGGAPTGGTGGTAGQGGGGQGGGGATTSSGGGGAGGGQPVSPCRTVSGWQTTPPFADDAHVSHPLPSFARAGRYYVHTMNSAGSGDRILYMAAQNPDGSLGDWQMASPDHGGGPHGFTALVAAGEAYHFRNGHIAHYPFGPDGVMTSDVELLEANPDTAFGGNRYVWDTAVFASTGLSSETIVHLGGFSFTGYEYRPHIYVSPVPPGPSFTSLGMNHPADRPGKSVFWGQEGGPGFIFSREGNGDRFFRAQLESDGSLGAFAELSALPAGTGNGRGDIWVSGQTLFVVRGAKVLLADIDPGSGALSAWKDAPPLPQDQIDITWGEGHLEGAAYGVIGDFVYVTGAKAVMFAELIPAECSSF